MGLSRQVKFLETNYKMSLLTSSESKGEYALNVEKSLVSTRSYEANIFTYTTSLNASFQTVGTLAIHASATAAKCPAGRILHLTGRKLHPTINPMTTFPGGASLLTTAKFLVGVYDPITFISGFIDPSSSMFAKYDQNIPNFFDNGPTANGGSVPPLGGQAGKLTLQDAGSLLESTAGDGVAVAAGNASVGQVTMVTTTCIISTTACTANSKIFLTQNSATPAALAVTTGPAAGTFTITGGSGAVVNWLIIN